MNDVLLFRVLRVLDVRQVRAAVIAANDLFARLAGLDMVLRERLRAMPDEQPTFYAVATLVWLLLARAGGPIPAYNVYKTLSSTEQRQAAAQLCERYLERRPSWRVRRQLVLLQEHAADSPEMIKYARYELEKHLNTAKTTPAKLGVKFDQHAAARALADLDELFSQLGHPMFLVSGTFLGAVRNGGFIDSEYDIDVGFFAADIDIAVVAEAMRRSGQYAHVSSNEMLIKGLHVAGTHVDVFVHFEERGLIWHGSNKHRWYNTPFALGKIALLGREYLAPTDADVYLTENYGDWRSPCAFWDTSFDTPNCVFAASKEALLMLVNYATNRDDRHRAEHALAALKENFGIDYTEQIPHGGSAELRAKLNNESVTLVAGEFDPFDMNTLRGLESLRSGGARLLVAVSGDDAYDRDKSRPGLQASERCELLRALRCVDDAFIIAAGDELEARIIATGADRLVVPAARIANYERFRDRCQVMEFPAAKP